MRVVGRTLIETSALLVLGVILGFGVNSLRGRGGGIDPTRAYFKKPDPASVHPTRADPQATDGPETPPDPSPGSQRTPEVSSPQPPPATPEGSPRPAPPAPGTADPAETGDHPEHPFQEILFDEVRAVFNDPNTALGVNVFVDARNDHAFSEGRIPGAIQCDHYQLAEYLGPVLDATAVAARVIVYCNGGDCEDSIFVCNDLMDAGVPYSRLYLYPGGWQEWKKNDMPIEAGE
jgi:rhodanese-related sulfurtransferase